LIQHGRDLVVAEHFGQWRPDAQSHLPRQPTGETDENGITPIGKATRETERKEDQFLSSGEIILPDIYESKARLSSADARGNCCGVRVLVGRPNCEGVSQSFA